MKIDQFEDFLCDDLSWRKMEISQLFRLINSSENKDVLIKSSVLLLYAHWEGYIKRSSKYYLRYVSEKKVKIKNLTTNFKAIVLRKFALECIERDSGTLTQELKFLQKHSKMEEKNFKLTINVDNDFDKDIINTKDNLSSKTLSNITSIIGMKYNAAMKTRSNYVDSVLLKNRNAIGHGSKVSMGESEIENITFDTVVKLKNFVVLMLDYYKEILFDYAEKEFYLVENSSLREEYEYNKEEELSRKLDELQLEVVHRVGNEE